MATTTILNQLERYITSTFEKVHAYYSSFSLSYLYMVLEMKSTTHKIFSVLEQTVAQMRKVTVVKLKINETAALLGM